MFNKDYYKKKFNDQINESKINTCDSTQIAINNEEVRKNMDFDSNPNTPAIKIRSLNENLINSRHNRIMLDLLNDRRETILIPERTSIVRQLSNSLNEQKINNEIVIDKSNIIEKEDNMVVLWSSDIEKRCLLFDEICQESSKKTKKSSIHHRKISNILSYSQIAIGSFGAFISVLSIIPDITKNIINTIIGGTTALLTGIKIAYKGDQTSQIEATVTIELEKISRTIQNELAKPVHLRINPFDFLVTLETERNKLIKQVAIEDE